MRKMLLYLLFAGTCNHLLAQQVEVGDTLIINPTAWHPFRATDSAFIGNRLFRDGSHTFVITPTTIRSQRMIGSCLQPEAYSNWIAVQDDTLHKFLLQHEAIMKTERIAPYVFIRSGTSQQQHVAVKFHHSTIIFITLHAGTKDAYEFSIDLDELDEQHHEWTPPNLNYAYNQSLYRVKLYNLLNERLERWSDRYVFRQSPPKNKTR